MPRKPKVADFMADGPLRAAHGDELGIPRQPIYPEETKMKSAVLSRSAKTSSSWYIGSLTKMVLIVKLPAYVVLFYREVHHQ